MKARLINRLARERPALQHFLVSEWCEGPRHRGSRLLEEALVLDLSTRLVDAFLRSLQGEEGALEEFVERAAVEAFQNGVPVFECLRALELLEEKTLEVLRPLGNGAGFVQHVRALLAGARARLLSVQVEMDK